MIDGGEFSLSESAPGVGTLTVVGVVDPTTIGTFEEALRIAQSRSTRGLIVILEEATYLCVRAYGMLSAAGARMTSNSGCQLIVVCSDEHIASSMLDFLSFQNRRVPALAVALRALREEAAPHQANMASVTRRFRSRALRETAAHR